jgi:hypothetical protein
MINRFSEVIPQLSERLKQTGAQVSAPAGALLAVELQGEKYLLDSKEQTGPILPANLEKWIAGLPADAHLILLTMGFFHPRAIAFLIQQGQNSRVALVQMGLASFFDEQARPAKFGETDTPVFKALEEEMSNLGNELAPVSCSYCSATAVGVCRDCGKLLCKDHFISCAICRGNFCHPDSGECYFRHQCE